MGGYPTTVFVRTGGGGDRPLTDRGVHPSDGSATIPGSGPAMRFARAGFAGVQVDGPLGGLRNTTHADEQFLMFNIFNPLALRDNTRESALELVLLAHVLEDVTLDASDCPGAGAVRFDLTRLALMGHSMGATIAPLVLAHEPRYGAVILSGAGGSWIENILWKQHPVEVRPALELIIGYPSRGLSLSRGDPVCTLFQWAAESADPQVYARRIVSEPAAGEAPRHALMMQGIVDHYIMPPIADGISLALGLDLGGVELDSRTPEVADLAPLGPLLPLVQRGPIALPAAGNVVGPAGTATAVVIQHPEDGFEDGHEVVFQTAAPQHEYRCFLASFATGTPVVLQGQGADDPCP
jgi:pimeloyl-ACP methyl ester carboxylesterase